MAKFRVSHRRDDDDDSDDEGVMEREGGKAEYADDDGDDLEA